MNGTYNLRVPRDLKVGSTTPWGRADGAETHAPGVTQVFTPGHGGIGLSPARNNKVPAIMRDLDGWYEEDCEVNIVLAVHLDVLPDVDRAKVHDSLAYWWPEEHAAAFPDEAAARQDGRDTSITVNQARRAEDEARRAAQKES